jgi:hypothetical protein
MNFLTDDGAVTAYYASHYIGLSLILAALLMLATIPFLRQPNGANAVIKRTKIRTSIIAILVGACLYLIGDLIRPASVDPRIILPIGVGQLIKAD